MEIEEKAEPYADGTDTFLLPQRAPLWHRPPWDKSVTSLTLELIDLLLWGQTVKRGRAASLEF